jgi:hypothetical protein
MENDESKIKISSLSPLAPIAMALNDGKYIQSKNTDSSTAGKQEIAKNSAAVIEQKPKTLSITRLGETWVSVDVDNRQFTKLGSPEHRISFDHMTYKGDHYEMRWDLFTEKPPLPGSLNNEDVVTLKIPPLVQIALQEMSEKYGIPAHELLKLSDFQVMLNQKALGEREKGVLPAYEILDRNYKVDLDHYCFRLADHIIPLKDFKPVSDPYGDRYAYMDTNTHQLVKIDLRNVKEMPPENIVKVTIPCNDKLDPYHVGKNSEPDLNTYLLANPMVSGQKATIVPLWQTDLPNIIKLNVNRELRQQFEQKQRINARKMRNGIR